MSTETFLITTFNRPRLCLDLLNDILALDCEARVVVVDDASSEDYSAVHALIAEHPTWRLILHTENYGRNRYVESLNQGLAVCRTHSPKRVWILQDDVRLSPKQYADACALWETLPKQKRGSLVLYTPDGAAPPPAVTSWTGLAASVYSDAVNETHHVDLSAIVSGAALSAIRYTIPLPEAVWLAQPRMSSGYGRGLSRALAASGFRMFSSVQPLVSTVVAASQMHPEERLRNPRLSTTNRYQLPVIATMATYPPRQKSLGPCVASLLPQVDKLYVYCNQYTPETLPACLRDPKIEVRFGENLTDTGKFAFDEDLGPDPVYHFACDDDLIYPPDYVSRMVMSIETADRKSIICVHGRLVPDQPIKHFYKDTKCFHGHRTVPENVTLHIPATCLTAYCTSTIRFGLHLFKAPKMTDIWVGVHAKNCGVPVVCIAHKEGWITTAHHGAETIYDTEFRNPVVQTRTINENMPWPAPAVLVPSSVRSADSTWDFKARSRKKAAVLPESWSVSAYAQYRPALEKLIRRLLSAEPRGKKILDFGCGFGRWEAYLRSLGFEYIGVDTSAEMLALDPSPNRKLWRTADALPTADIVFVFDVLHHIPKASLPTVALKLAEAAPRLILVEQFNAPGVDGTHRSDYGPLFKSVTGCDSANTGAIIWNGYRGNLR